MPMNMPNYVLILQESFRINLLYSGSENLEMNVFRL